MFTPKVIPAGVSPFVSTFSPEGPYGSVPGATGTLISATYPSAQRILYYPIVVPTACTMYRFFWLNGATASTDNVQIGVYNDNDSGGDGPGTALLRGTSTTASGANVCQFDNITNTPITKGRYWLAIWCGGTTTTFVRSAPSASVARQWSGYLESSASLPATATPAQNTNAGFIPIFGFTTVSAP